MNDDDDEISTRRTSITKHIWIKMKGIFLKKTTTTTIIHTHTHIQSQNGARWLKHLLFLFISAILCGWVFFLQNCIQKWMISFFSEIGIKNYSTPMESIFGVVWSIKKGLVHWVSSFFWCWIVEYSIVLL